MRRVALSAIALLVLAAAPMLRGQKAAPGKPLIVIDGVTQMESQPQPGQGDPFARFFIPPELVMQHQVEIGLTDAQRSTLMTAIQQAQSKFVEIQFKLAGEGQKLVGLLQGATIDESQTLEEVDRILALEREMKRAQIGLLVRIKNALTPTQQAKLMQLRQGKE
jgi:Spy/CpxP family protein refolding chaperone